MKNLFKILLVVLSLLGLPTNLLAQKSEKEQLAQQFYEEKDYQKAADLYLELYNETQAQAYYVAYLKTVKETGNWKELEKFIRKQIKKQPQQLSMLVDLGSVLRAQQDNEKALKSFEEAIDKIGPDQSQIMQLAQAFIALREYDFALKAYEKGRKVLDGMYPFHYEIAEVLLSKNDFPGAIASYLNSIDMNEAYLQQVQYIMQGLIGGEDNKGPRQEELRKQLLKKIQSNPDKLAFAELLIWLFIQQKDYESAFTQSKSLDKRMNGNSGKLISLANICMSNQEYDVALKCYEAEIAKGSNNPYYSFARMEWVNVLNKKITNAPTYAAADLINLEDSYKKALDELGRNAQTLPLLRGLAHLKAFYMNNTTEAFALLDEALNYKNAPAALLAECKLELGDILLFTGDLWECSLLYSQVEKSFKHEPIGQEAKLKNARLSFYKGEFEWAQAQLDVLKAATSKLIANDALELSLVIIDNAPDSDFVPLSIFSRGDLLAFRNMDSLAEITFDSISTGYLNHPLADDVLYRKYKLAMKKSNYVLAASYLQKIIDGFGTELLGDDARFYLAELNEFKLINKDKAMELYQEVLTNNPGSLYTVEARKRYRKLRGDSFN